MKKLLIISLLFLMANLSLAADISFRASVNKKSVALNESFVYSLTITGNTANFPEPELGNLGSFNQFSRGRSQTVSIINGRASARVTFTYTLGPHTPGVFVIPPATLNYNGQVYTSNPVEITITAAKSIQSQQGSQSSAMQVRRIEPKLFVRASVNKNTVYENEKIVYTYDFYTNVDPVSNPEYMPPDFSGFWNDGASPSSRFEKVGNEIYLVSEVKTELYPIAVGKRTIGPTRLRVAIANFIAPGTIDEMISQFFAGTNQQVQEKILETPPVTVTVLPLPKEGRPADFYGSVGSFQVSAKVDKTNVQVDEPATLTVTVRGEGNLKSVTKFEVSAPGIKFYDPMISEVDSHTKIFAIPFMATSPGRKTIPSVSLAFFNPATKSYEMTRTQSIVIEAQGDVGVSTLVDGGAGGTGEAAVKPNKEIKSLGNYSTPFITNIYFYIIFVPFILLLLGGIMFNLFGKSAGAKGSATKASKMIEKAQEDLDAGRLGGLFDSIYNALIEAISAKSGIVIDELQKEKQILEKLKETDIPEEAIKNLEEVFEKINLYKFAAVRADEKTLKEMLDHVKVIVEQLK